MSEPTRGGCLCRAVRYAFEGAPLAMLNCHCRDCQHASGGAGANAVIVAANALSIEGEVRWFESLADSGNPVRRGFCPTCGAPLFSANATLADFVAIKAGSLDDPSLFRPMFDVWTSSAQPWDRMDPSLPKFEKNRPMPGR